MSQKQAVVSTILAVLAERGVEYQMGGDVPISDVLTDKDKADTREAIFTMFRNGDITFKDEPTAAKYASDSELKKYVSGLVNNHIRKTKEFNCGKTYVIKNPGSRAHVADEQLRELTKLSAQCADDPEAQKQIADAIVKRKAEIAAEKAKSVTINPDALPEALRHLVK